MAYAAMPGGLSEDYAYSRCRVDTSLAKPLGSTQDKRQEATHDQFPGLAQNSEAR